MTINYTLVENHLTEAPDDYVAQVQAIGTAELEDVIERIIDQGSTVTRADIISVLENYHSAVERMVLEGLGVNTPTANFKASVKGVFDGLDDMFDPSRHSVRAVVSAGKRYRKAIEERARLVKQETIKPKPSPLSFTDTNSGARDTILTPGGMGQVLGHRLKFDPDDENQGVFLVPASGSETRVAVVGRNKPSDLMFMVPEGLAPGVYRLDVRATIFGGEEVRSGSLDAPLTVT